LENKIFTKSKYKDYFVEILRTIFNYPKIYNEAFDSLSRLKFVNMIDKFLHL